MPQKEIRVALIRGGTSKGVFIRDAELAGFDPAARDRILLALFGSPDPRQIDGLGGGTSTTSKVVIVGESSRPGVDLEYTFGQVSLDKSLVDYGGTCGNLTTAVGVFGINEGMVEATDPLTRLVLFNRNTQRTVVAEIPTSGGVADPEGNLRIAGVPGTGARILTRYRDPAGGVTGRLLPTGNPVDTVHVGGETVSCSIVDAVNPVVFVEASAVGLTGRETPAELNGNRKALEALETVRGEASVLARIVESPGTAAAQSPGVPKVAFVSPPCDYRTVSGERLSASEINVLARILSMQKAHPTYAVGAAICTAVAALCPGTVVCSAACLDGDPRRERTTTITIGHPVGTMRVELTVDYPENGPPIVVEAAVERTARYLIAGTAFYRL